MKITKSGVIYALICNLIVATMLDLVASLVASNIIDPINFLINLAVGYTIGVIVGITFPLVEIGKKFTRFWKVDAITFKGNRFYRFLAVLAINTIYFVILSPSLSILNYFLLGNMTPFECFISWCYTALPLFTCGYIVSIVADKITYTIVHKIDPSF